MDIIQCHATHPLAAHMSHSLKTNVTAVVNEKSGDKVRIYTFVNGMSAHFYSNLQVKYFSENDKWKRGDTVSEDLVYSSCCSNLYQTATGADSQKPSGEKVGSSSKSTGCILWVLASLWKKTVRCGPSQHFYSGRKTKISPVLVISILRTGMTKQAVSVVS